MATSSRRELASWFASPQGERLLAEQASYLTDAARRFHGDTLLWAGCHTPLADTVRGCMVRNRFMTLAPGVSACPDFANFRGELQALPLPNNSLDAAVLHHALEVADDPRTALREVARAMAPGGRLVLCGFNPLSLWGLRLAYARFFRDAFSGVRLVSPVRLQDWLTVLGFELCDEVRYLAYGMPFGSRSAGRDGGASRGGRLNRLVGARLIRHNPPVGGAYVVTAIKQAMSRSRDWRLRTPPNPKLAPVAYPKLSTWNRIEPPG